MGSLREKFEKIGHSRKLLWLCLIFAALALSAAISWMGFCPIERFFGIPCPGCGMTRALTALLRGDWRLSLQMHPMLIPTAVFAAVCVYCWLRRGRNILLAKPGLFYGCAMLGVWIERMALFFPRVEPMVFDWDSVVGMLLRR